MEWLGNNWLLLALGAGALAFIAFGRGGCGMTHGGHGRHQASEGDPPRETTPSANPSTLSAAHVGRSSGQGAGQPHRHGCC